MKTIVWRLYLTSFAIVSLGVVLGVYLDVNQYIEATRNRKTLVALLATGQEFWVTFKAGKGPECVERLEHEAGTLWDCVEWDGLSTEIKQAGLSVYSPIGYNWKMENTKIGAGFWLFFMFCRYWVAWLFFGRKPDTFP